MENRQTGLSNSEPMKEMNRPDQSINISAQMTELIFEQAAKFNLSKHLSVLAKPLMARE